MRWHAFNVAPVFMTLQARTLSAKRCASKARGTCAPLMRTVVCSDVSRSTHGRSQSACALLAVIQHCAAYLHLLTWATSRFQCHDLRTLHVACAAQVNEDEMLKKHVFRRLDEV
jgi:hypothetical protein